jgi:hypothetical protein
VRPFLEKEDDMEMRFRERLALALFLAPSAVGLLLWANLALTGQHVPLSRLLVGLEFALSAGAMLGVISWVLLSTVWWIATGRW